MGDSMLHGIDERRMSKNGLVKVRCFPGSTVADLKNFYMQPLLSKKPSHVIMHIGTNDAANKGSTADIREFTHDDEYDNHNDTDQPYRFRSRCGKFDLSIDTRRGERIYANHISVRCEPTSQYWKGVHKTAIYHPSKAI